jgi:hypothetical protein
MAIVFVAIVFNDGDHAGDLEGHVPPTPASFSYAGKGQTRSMVLLSILLLSSALRSLLALVYASRRPPQESGLRDYFFPDFHCSVEVLLFLQNVFRRALRRSRCRR